MDASDPVWLKGEKYWELLQDLGTIKYELRTA